MTTYNPIRMLKNLFNDIMLKLTGTYVGAPQDPPWEDAADE